MVTRDRYDSCKWLVILCLLWVPILLWGLVPW
jgi:cation/acetate symporter